MKNTKPEPMSVSRFTALLDAYGADPTRWPEAERTQAEALLQSHPDAAPLLEAARQLDAQLTTFEVAQPSAQLRARILEIPIRQQRKPARFAFAGWRIAALALVPCALGFLSGALLPDTTEQDDGWSEEVASITLLGEVSEEDWP